MNHIMNQFSWSPWECPLEDVPEFLLFCLSVPFFPFFSLLRIYCVLKRDLLECHGDWAKFAPENRRDCLAVARGYSQ